MNDDLTSSPPARAVAALRRFARPRANADVAERCDLCAAPLAHEHQHLLEPNARQVLCACDACAVLFSTRAGAKYRRVPRQVDRWTDFMLSDEQWAGLGVPISLAFFARSSPRQQVIATYPSPGGPTESPIPAEAWDGLVEANAVLGELEPDVEALLINRVNGARGAFRTPIDECYKLVGLIRLHWRGLSGGDAVWQRIDGFFKDLTARADARSAHA